MPPSNPNACLTASSVNTPTNALDARRTRSVNEAIALRHPPVNQSSHARLLQPPTDPPAERQPREEAEGEPAQHVALILPVAPSRHGRGGKVGSPGVGRGRPP